MDILSTDIDALSWEHLENLIREEVPEGEHVEYKRELSSSDPSGDPWTQGRSKIGKEARDKILEEIVAFANANGGVLVLGGGLGGGFRDVT